MLAFACFLLITFTQKHQNVLDVHRDVSTRVHHSLPRIHEDICCDSGQLQRYVRYNKTIRIVTVSDIVEKSRKALSCNFLP